ncbi:NAD dependent epimerase/dehydratase family protein [Myxococcus stipitatus DSM 14675]|uniref:NAD dependent epimerase/dehydratase family protein n=1 Tax=Myxococcus stipitatus (strain DSM 14675 / JCM 12634 / Mx s8) TaxID=1278073 RepID=L7U6W4_MYXSD|nr:SDR family oxidoreductase [Myxococcus stipitatus]AGC42219.1 NAD dependent epimerase/dehydratase family protein [Myxococcus stipitatus DSM 14675]
MRAFVTGSTGLLGSNVVRALVAGGHTVRALARSASKARQVLGGLEGVEVVEGDMLEVKGFAAALDGCDVVIHTAAYFREYYAPGDHWPKLYAINVKATVELAEEAHRRGVKRFVDISSSGTVGTKPDGSPGDEHTPPAPVASANLYFKSKVESERELNEFSARTGLGVVYILPGWMFGPWDAGPTAAGQFVLDFLAGKMPALLDGGSALVDARDVARATVVAAEQGRAGERYVVGGEFVDLATLSQTLEQVSGVKGPRRTLPHGLALALAVVGQTWARLTGSATSLTVEGVQVMHAKLSVDSTKARRELGASFRPLEETLRDTVAWLREHKLQAAPAVGKKPQVATAP